MSINDTQNNPANQEKLEPILTEYEIDPRALIATFRITKNVLKRLITRFEGLSKEHQDAIKAVKLLAKDFEKNLGFLLDEPELIVQNTEHRLNQYPERLKLLGGITTKQDMVFKYIPSYTDNNEIWQEDLATADEALTYLLVQTQLLFETQHNLTPSAADTLLKAIENLPMPTLDQMSKRYPAPAP